MLFCGGSNEYPQSMFWIQNNKNRNTPVNPILLYIKVKLNGKYIIWTCFPDVVFNIYMQIYVVLFVTEINRDPNAATLICGISDYFKETDLI